jgi:Trk-type K+ transport system membrane component
MIPVDVGTYWSGFGQLVILLLLQIGGIGVMTIATLIATSLTKRLDLGTRSAAELETKNTAGGGFRYVLRRVFVVAFVIELSLAVWLIANFYFRYDFELAKSLWYGTFHAVSAFNNAGIALFSDSFASFRTDALILLPIIFAVILGGIGFPVIFELRKKWRRPESWSILTRISVSLTVALLIIGTAGYMFSEYNNPDTFAPLSLGEQGLAAFFMSAISRTAGFSIVDLALLDSEASLLTMTLMFIGGGSAGTAGGVKITTIGILVFIVLAEIRNRDDVVIGRRRIASTVQRQALSIFALGAATVLLFTFVLTALTPFEFEQVLFETIAAFSTTGLSVGVLAELEDLPLYVLTLLMFVGRLGPLILATALALNSRTQLSRVPEEKMIIG